MRDEVHKLKSQIQYINDKTYQLVDASDGEPSLTLIDNSNGSPQVATDNIKDSVQVATDTTNTNKGPLQVATDDLSKSLASNVQIE